MRSLTWLARYLCLATLTFTACVAPLDGQFTCPLPERSCPPDFYCHADGVCRTTPDATLDAGPRDASRDGFSADADRPDGSGRDAMPLDAPMIDATIIDAPMIDAPACDPSSCETSDPCTSASCLTGACELVNNTEVCNDGVFCNGADRCAGGVCTPGAADPCDRAVSRCNETTGACDLCGGFDEPCCDRADCRGGRLCSTAGATRCRCVTGDCGTTGYCNTYGCLSCGEALFSLCCDLPPRCPGGGTCDTMQLLCL